MVNGKDPAMECQCSHLTQYTTHHIYCFAEDVGESLFVCVEDLRPSQPNGVMSSTVSLPNHTFTGQA